MGKAKYVEKDQKMGLKIREKKDDKVVTKFIPHSNFVFHPVAQVCNLYAFVMQ